MLAQERDVEIPTPPDGEVPVLPFQQPSTLYITLGPDGSLKMGTCAHCVIEEHGRPGQAWEADGDKELDFDRDTLFAHLAELGIVLTNRQAYVCP